MLKLCTRFFAPSLLTIVALIPCSGCPGVGSPPPCPGENPSVTPSVAGVYRYFGINPFLLVGTITFEQEGTLVRVTDTTYENANDRALRGEGTLQGNRLTIQLVPKNGDTNYRADVTFIFSDDGSQFCVEFSDTNGDAGDLGTYRGTRISS